MKYPEITYLSFVINTVWTVFSKYVRCEFVHLKVSWLFWKPPGRFKSETGNYCKSLRVLIDHPKRILMLLGYVAEKLAFWYCRERNWSFLKLLFYLSVFICRENSAVFFKVFQAFSVKNNFRNLAVAAVANERFENSCWN